MKELDNTKKLNSPNEKGTDLKSVPFLLYTKLSALLKNHCPVDVQDHPLKAVQYMACRNLGMCTVLNLKSNMKNSTEILQKSRSGISHKINNSEGWYQNVLFGGNIY